MIFYFQGNSLKGWIELASGKDVKKAGKYFEESLVAAPVTKNLDGFFGKAKYLEAKHNYSSSLETLNQLVVAFPQFVPTLIEKMKIQMALQTWDDARDTALRFTELFCFIWHIQHLYISTVHKASAFMMAQLCQTKPIIGQSFF